MSRNDIPQQIRRAYETAPRPGRTDIDAVAHRSRKLRVRRRVVGAFAVVAVAGALGGSLWVLAPLGGNRTVGAGTSSSAELLPDTVRIVCDDSGTHVLTPKVRPQLDGVHFEVDNRLGEPLSFSVQTSTGEGFGDSADPGVTLVRGTGPRGGWSVPPGLISVRCLRSTEDAGVQQGWAELRVVDQEGVYVSTALECEGSLVSEFHMDHPQGTEGQMGDPVELAQEVLNGLQEGDKSEPAGYPEYDVEAIVRVVREDRTIATVHFFKTDNGGWLAYRGSRCGDSGLAA